MNRPIGVTVIAVLSLIGSILTLLFGVLTVVITAIVPVPATVSFPGGPAYFRLILALTSLFYILPALWGIVTSIGLFRMSGWARISMIVFSVLLILGGGFAALGSFTMPLMMPEAQNGSPQVTAVVGIVMGILWIAVTGIGIWWLVFFTRPRVKEQFAAAILPLSAPSGEVFTAQMTSSSQPAFPVLAKPARPISLTIIAWLLLVSCCFMPLAALLRLPTIILTSMLTGWPAVLFYVAFGVVNFYIGFGLLRFKPFAREIGIGYLFFMFINSAVFYFAPGGRVRMQALIDQQWTIFPWMRELQNSQPMQFNLTPAMWFGGVMGLAFIAVELYFLITRKRAYEVAARAIRVV